MNFFNTEFPSQLYVEPAAGDDNAFYITTGKQEYAPAIASVFGNPYASTSVEDAKINAAMFASMPELLDVLSIAEKLSSILPGRNTTSEIDLSPLKEAVEAVYAKMESLI